MYQQRHQTPMELPSAAQLRRSTVLSFIVAAILLVTVVLPAEYAIDPTGMGRLLGLQEMGEVKAQLEAEAEAEEGALKAVAPEGLTADAANILARLDRIEAMLAQRSGESDDGEVKASPAVTEAAPQPPLTTTRELQLTLKPDQGAEVKVEMKKGRIISYQWTTEGGVVNFDTHGDPYQAPKSFYHGYGKGKSVEADTGQIEAAFDGYHGWFWRNRGKKEVTVRLIVTGDFIEIKRVI